MFIDRFNRIFDCSIRVSRSFLQARWQGTANIWDGVGPARRAFWLHHCLKLLSVSRVLLVLVSYYSCFMLVHSL